jgi:ABC-type oligopeptide transport system substrate-binding subunit
MLRGPLASTMMSRRRLLATSTSFALATALVACGGGGGPGASAPATPTAATQPATAPTATTQATTSAAPSVGATPTAAPRAAAQATATGKAIRVTLPYIQSGFDSFDHAYWTAQLLLSQGTIFEGLFGYDDKLNVVPKIAAQTTHSPDNTVWTYKLRTDKKWANGDPVTVHDFYNAWMRFLSPELKDTPMWAGAWSLIKNAGAYKSGAAAKEDVGIRVIGDDTLEVTLTQPYSSFSNALVMSQAMPIHSKTLQDHPNDWWDPKYQAYNGPYVVKAWVKGGDVTLARNPNYVGDKYGNVDEIVLKPYGDPNALMQAFQNGELQYAPLSDISQITFVKRNPKLQAGYHEELSWAKLEVRKAFAMAIDKAALTSKVLKDMAIPANAFTGDQSIAKEVTPLPYDPAQARKLLADAGYPNGQGLPVVKFFAPPANSGQESFVEAIAKMWEDNLGVKVQIQNLDWGPYSTMQWSDENKNTAPGYIPQGGAMNFLDPMGLYQNVGHIWWFMDYAPEWTKTSYWAWKDKLDGVSKLKQTGNWSELQQRADAAWKKHQEIVAAEDNDWGKSLMIPPTFKEQFDKIADRFKAATDDKVKLTAYQDALTLVLNEERFQDQYSKMTDMNKKAQRLMASLNNGTIADAPKYLIPLNQLAIDSAWMIPIYIPKIIYAVDPKLSGIVQNKLSWGNIFQFNYLRYNA